MGFLRDLQGFETKAGLFGDARDMGRRLWRQVFGVPKENPEHLANFPAVRPKYKTNVSGAASFKRLIEAMRSFAPGGWSDDRIEESRQWTGAQYVAGHRKAEQMSLCEFQVFHKDPKHPDGKRPVERNETTPDHDGPYDLVKLLEKPNSQDTFGDLCYIFSQQMDLTGMALTWMVPNENGTPMELYNLPTAIAIPQPAINPDYPDGYYRIQPLYPYGPFSSYPTPASAVGAPVPAEWIIRMKFPHPILRYDGFSPYTGLRLQIDTVTQMDRSRWYTLKRLLSPWAVLDMSDVEGIDGFPEEEIERIRADFENEHQGTENVGKLLVPFPGAKLNPWNTNLKDLEYAQGWEQILSFVLAGLGVTKPVAGMMEQTAYAAFFASLKQFHLLTLKPQCHRIAAGLTRRLAPFFGKDLIIEIRTERIDDHEILNGAINLAMQAKCITKNEIRKLLAKTLDLEPTREDWGEEIAGTEEQQQQPGMPGMPGAGGAMPGGAVGAQPGQGGAGVPNAANSSAPAPPTQQATDPLDEILGLTPAKEEGPEAAGTPPTPNTLDQGSLGPRKNLLSSLRAQYKAAKYPRKRVIVPKPKKSLYDEIMEVVGSNGNSHS